MRVVVAEDDRDMCTLVADALRDEGHVVVELSDGPSLRSEVARPAGEGPELIVSDVRLPGMTGLAVLRALRAAGSTVPVMLMTGFGDDCVRREAMALGATVFDKPFKLGELRAAIRALSRPSLSRS